MYKPSIIPNGTKVEIKHSKENGVIISSELKRVPNSMGQIRFYQVKTEKDKIDNYEATELRNK